MTTIHERLNWPVDKIGTATPDRFPTPIRATKPGMPSARASQQSHRGVLLTGSKYAEDEAWRATAWVAADHGAAIFYHDRLRAQALQRAGGRCIYVAFTDHNSVLIAWFGQGVREYRAKYAANVVALLLDGYPNLPIIGN